MSSGWAVRSAVAVTLVFGIMATACMVAQESPQATPPQTTNDALHAMSQLAAVIFTGQVVAIRRMEGENGSTGVVEIQFAIEDAVRGVSGSTYTLREWAGLWPAGDGPFRPGQRYLMLLHAPSAAGLSSPVGGMDGAIPIRGTAQSPATGASEARVATSKKNAGASAPEDNRVADLRWVATRAMQPLTYRTEPGSHAMNESNSVSADSMTAGPPSETPAAAPQDMAYTTVLGILQRWEKAGDAAH